MQAIYDQHDKHFSNVSAWVAFHPSYPDVAVKVAVRYPRDGAGRLYAYVHVVGLAMVRGSASGYGYDKVSAAVASAVEAIKPGGQYLEAQDAVRAALQALDLDGGWPWNDALRRAGWKVWQAV